MRRIVLLITNAMFVAHILFGCCLHHAHGDEAQADTTQFECKHCCCGHHHAPANGDNADHQQPKAPADDEAPASPCEHGRCNFVKVESQRVDLTATDFVWAPLVVVEISPSTNGQHLAPHAYAAAARPTDCPLHVLHCALLI